MNVSVLSLQEVSSKAGQYVQQLINVANLDHLLFRVYDPSTLINEVHDPMYQYLLKGIAHFSKDGKCIILRSKLEKSPLFLLPSNVLYEEECHQEEFVLEFRETLRYLKEKQCFGASVLCLVCRSNPAASRMLNLIRRTVSMSDLPSDVILKVDFEGNTEEFLVFPADELTRRRKNFTNGKILVAV